MNQDNFDDLNTPLFGPAEVKPCVEHSAEEKTGSDFGTSNSSDESGSDSGSGSGSDSESDSSKHSEKSTKSDKSEGGNDDNNSDDSGSSDNACDDSRVKDEVKEEKEEDEEEEKTSFIPVEDTDSQDTPYGSRTVGRKTNILELKQEWDQRPDLYGIRRSGRSRKEVERYVPVRTSGSDGDGGKRRGRKRKDSGDWHHSQGSDDDSEQDSDSEEDYRPTRSTRAASRATKPSTRSSRQSARGRQATKAARGRQRRLSSSGSSYSDDMRAPYRRQTAMKKVSYKECSDNATDSDDIIETAVPVEAEVNDKETIEKVLDWRLGRKGATGSKTTSYNVQQNGNPNSSSSSLMETEEQKEGEGERKEKNEEITEKQFLVKWKGWAHIHNTWESVSSLQEQKVNGMKKLENYIKIHEEIEEEKKHASPEQLEFYFCRIEMEKELTKSHQDVERVVAKVEREYLCKWVGLPYSECTWEDADLIQQLFQPKVDAFQARLKCKNIPSTLSRVLKHRPKFSAMKLQPSFLGSEELQLRDYQLDGVNWLIHSWTKMNSVILADEMGLGKTIQIVSFLSYLYNAQQLYGPFLLVVPLSTLTAWQREFEHWAPELNVVVYIGDVTSRNTIREYEWVYASSKRYKFNVLLTTYEIVLKDKTFLGNVPWAFLGVDEAHRLKNHDSLLYRSLKDFNTNHRILVTGTPLQNSLKELWSLLHFIMPVKFDDWSEFEERHSSQDKEGLGALHKQLEPYLIRRVKKDVEKSLPAKVEQILRVEMSSIQKQYYKWILTRNYKALSKGQRGSIGSFVNIIMELKKCCNHANLIRTEEAEESQDRLQALVRGSGKLILLDKLLVRLRDTGHRVLIFSQMVRMLDILAEYLQFRSFPYQRLDGSIRGELRKQAMDHFNAEGSQDFCFLLSTRAGGLGVNLATADTVIIFDSDWNPQNDLQAQARAHRIGQKNQVSVYRLVTKQSVEETIVERAKQKMVLDHLVIQSMDTTGHTVLNRGQTSTSNSTPFSKEELASILKFGAEDLFKQEEGEEDEPQVDIDEILKFAETHETETATAGDELLSQFKVISFDNMEEDTNDMNTNNSPEGKEWEDIIPEHLRDKMEEEERQQQLLQLHLPPRSRKTIKQLSMECPPDDEKHSRRRKDDDSDASNEDEGDEEDDRPKKRGRPRVSGREHIRGFTDSELRRFIKSYKKFANPLSRLDSIAVDAELEEKSEADLKKLAEVLQRSVDESMEEYNQKMKEDPSFDGKKTHRGPTFKLSNVMVNAQSVAKAQAELDPLYKALPADRQQRKQYLLTCYVKRVHWDCLWDSTDDSNLLKGVYEYGMGSWEAIKMDTELQLHDKILIDAEQKKPQAKHLQTRVEYILKMLHKQAEFIAASKATAKGKVKGKRKPKSKAEVIDDLSSGSEDLHIKDDTNDSVSLDLSAVKKLPTVKPSKDKSEESDISDLELDDEAESKKGKRVKQKVKKEKKEKADGEKKEKNEDEKKQKKEKKDKKEKSRSEEPAKKDDKKKKDKKKKVAGPMHFTASAEPIAIDDEALAANEDPKVFQECKDKMREVKKALRQLDKAQAEPDNKTLLKVLRTSLLQIGDHINKCVGDMCDPDQIKFWRTQLWVFVSQFTDLSHDKLHKLYKKTAAKRRDVNGLEPSHSDSQHSLDSNHGVKRLHDKRDVNHQQVKKPCREDRQGDRSSSGKKARRPKAEQGNTDRPPPLHKDRRQDHSATHSAHRPPPQHTVGGRGDSGASHRGHSEHGTAHGSVQHISSHGNGNSEHGSGQSRGLHPSLPHRHTEHGGGHDPSHPSSSYRDGGRSEHRGSHRSSHHKDWSREDHGGGVDRGGGSGRHGSMNSPDRWQLASPLARAEDVPGSRYKSSDRYNDGGGRDRYKNNSSDSYHGRSHQFGGYHGDREGGHRSEWSGDYHRSEFRHYSREQPGSYQRQHNGWKQRGNHSYGESRKRRHDDSYGDRSHRRPYQGDPHSSEYNDYRIPPEHGSSRQDSRTSGWTPDSMWGDSHQQGRPPT